MIVSLTIPGDARGAHAGQIVFMTAADGLPLEGTIVGPGEYDPLRDETRFSVALHPVLFSPEIELASEGEG